MTWICVLGTELSARLQNGLILAQTLALLVFGVVALVRGLSGDSPLGGLDPSWGWLNPFGAGAGALSGGLLLGVFAYWGWESAVNLTEETRDSTKTPGRAAIVSTVVLLVTYVGVTIAVLAFAGTEYLSENADEEEAIFALLSTEVMGGWDWVVLLAVATAAIASTQTTILPASRTGLSMARRHALPRRFGHIDPRHRTPDVSTWWVGGIASVWFVAGEPAQRERAVRHDHRAVAAHRLLLRADRHRLRGLQPAPADPERVGVLPHRRGAADRLGAARSGCWVCRSATSPTRRTPTRGRPGSASARRWSSASGSSSSAWS